MIKVMIETIDGDFEYEICDPVESNEPGYVEAIKRALAEHCAKCGVPWFDDDDEEPRGTTPGCPGFRGNC